MKEQYKNKKYDKGQGRSQFAKGDRADRPARRFDNRRDDGPIPSNIVVGRNAVAELVKSGAPVDKILVSGREGSVLVIIAEARAAGIPVVDSTNESLDRLSHGEHHQGIVAMVAEKEYSTVEDILAIAEERGE